MPLKRMQITDGFRQLAATLSHRALTGAAIGALTGLLVACVDVASGLLGGYVGSRLGLALYALALLVTATSLGGALLALLWTATERLTARWPGRTTRALAALLDAMPLAALMLYPPMAWLSDRGLDAARQRVAHAVLLALLAIAVAGTHLARWLIRRLARLPRGHGRVGGAFIAFAGVVATACYAADARLFLDDDYAELHDGLAGAFVAAMAVVAACALWLLERRRPEAAPPARRALVIGAFALCLSLGLLERLQLDAFRSSQALVFNKVTVRARLALDVDGDGHAAVLGGTDCAPFDAHRSPGTVEVPGNDIDEDCSGTAESWPLGPPPPIPRGAQDAKPNVLLITVDTLRADHLGAYGYARPTSPNIDRLARQSIVFTRAFSQATKTWDSVPSFLTGLYPSSLPREYKRERKGQRQATNFRLKKSVGLIAEAFHARGYATQAVVSSGFMDNVGLGRGFERFKVLSEPARAAQKLVASVKEPFFVWLHYAGPHAPYRRDPKHDFGASALDRYDSEIAREDAQLGRVLKKLDQRRLRDSTIVVLNSDHGEEFGEHGGQYHTRKHYRELLHVPLIMRIPGVQPARVDDVVELIDIVPTLHELCNLEPPRSRLDGQSLLPTLTSRRPPELGGAFAEGYYHPQGVLKSAFFDGRYRLVEDRVLERRELFDVQSDPLEQRDIAAAHPELVSALRQRIAVRALRSRSPRVAEPADVTIATTAE